MKVAWEPVTKLHATLKFLGDTDEQRVPDIYGALETVAATAPPLSLRYREVGCFPAHGNPNVVWIGIEDMNGNLTSLQERIEHAMENIGIGREQRPFKAHLTIGRVKGGHRPRSLLTTMKTVTFESQPVTLHEIVLVRSELKPTGSVYTILKSIPLNG
jgi:2'-5' RNA ligase